MYFDFWKCTITIWTFIFKMYILFFCNTQSFSQHHNSHRLWYTKIIEIIFLFGDFPLISQGIAQYSNHRIQVTSSNCLFDSRITREIYREMWDCYVAANVPTNNKQARKGKIVRIRECLRVYKCGYCPSLEMFFYVIAQLSTSTVIKWGKRQENPYIRHPKVTNNIRNHIQIYGFWNQKNSTIWFFGCVSYSMCTFCTHRSLGTHMERAITNGIG